MCGINGIIGNIKDKENTLKQMNKSINHRGPDDEGFFIDDKVGLAQVRLSILDLSDAGHQPMFYNKNLGASSDKYQKENIEKSKYSITYNGEIYNYKDIKKELEDLGYIFTTKTDTEVILASYIQWGEDCVNKFNGMWAFCVYDKEKNILFCSRDRLGVKPFVYYYKNGIFAFSSEIKGLLNINKLNINNHENINSNSIDYFFTFGNIPAPFTIFKDTFKLGAGENIVLDINNGKLNKYRYFNYKKYEPKLNKKQAKKEIEETFKDAVRLRMISDTEVGAFLSGGLDSSWVTLEILKNKKDIKTYGVGFYDKKLDESKYMKIVANDLNVNLNHTYFDDKDFEKYVGKYQDYFDEPFGDFGFLPSFKNSEEMSKDLKVTLSGDGGDEIFGGYSTYKNGLIFHYTKKIPYFIRNILFKIINTFKKEYDLSLLGKIRELLIWVNTTSDNELVLKLNGNNKYLSPVAVDFYKSKMDYYIKLCNGNLSEGLRNYTIERLSDNFLTKTDITTMANSLESRSPFLDYRFIKLSNNISWKYKYSLLGKTKTIMRDILKGKLPEIIVNKPKQGFTPPFVKYIEKRKYTIYDKIGKLENIISNQYFKDYLQKVLKSGDFKKYSDFIIRAYLYILWYEKWIKNTK